jgi:hypothetical protein
MKLNIQNNIKEKLVIIVNYNEIILTVESMV